MISYGGQPDGMKGGGENVATPGLGWFHKNANQAHQRRLGGGNEGVAKGEAESKRRGGTDFDKGNWRKKSTQGKVKSATKETFVICSMQKSPKTRVGDEKGYKR